MKWAKSILCVAVGIVLFLAAEVVDTQSSHVENGTLYRNPCGKGDSIYEFSAKDAKGRELKTVLTVPERFENRSLRLWKICLAVYWGKISLCMMCGQI